MSPKRLLLVLPAAAIAFSLAACSAPAARPSVDEVSAGIQKAAKSANSSAVFTDEVSDCVAKELVDSKVSDSTLVTIAEGKEPEGADEQKLITKVLEGAAETCLTAK